MTHIPYLTANLVPEHDRRTRLLVMGILLLILGGLSGLMIVAAVLMFAIRPRGMPTMHGQQVSTVLIYGGAAAMFVSTGLGSIQRRRWARPVVLAVAWPWLLMGICGTGAVLFSMVHLSHAMSGAGASSLPSGMPASGFAIVIFVAVGMSAIIYIGFPLALILCYRSPEVQSTLDFYDPHARWTDGAPIRVLSLCFLMLVTAAGLLANIFAGVAPFFGILLKGPAAMIVMPIVAGLFLLATWWNYRLKMSGWKLSLALFIIMPLSAIVTFLRVPMAEFYRAMGLSDSEMEAVRQVNGMSVGQLIGWTVFGAAVGIGYLIFTRSSFVTPERASELSQTPPESPQETA